MTTFETGKTYEMKSIYDHECTWEYKVLRRTKSTITIQDAESGEVKRCVISKYSEKLGSETVYPLGKNSGASLSSDNETSQELDEEIDRVLSSDDEEEPTASDIASFEFMQLIKISLSNENKARR